MLIAQITDLHAGSRIEMPGYEVDTLARVAKAVTHLNGLDPAPHLVLATGDLTRDGTREEYEALKAAFAPLAMPLYLLPGNHDDRAMLRAVFAEHGYLPGDGFLHYTIEDGPLRIIALDTHVPGENGGELCAERLAWFEATLGEAPEQPTLVAMHHPPFSTGLPEFDCIGLAGAEAMGEIVARHPQIETILCGHVHREITLRWQGTLVTVTPSAAYQYPLELRDGVGFHPVDEPPACRLCHWRPEVGLVSHLSYIAA